MLAIDIHCNWMDNILITSKWIENVEQCNSSLMERHGFRFQDFFFFSFAFVCWCFVVNSRYCAQFRSYFRRSLGVVCQSSAPSRPGLDNQPNDISNIDSMSLCQSVYPSVCLSLCWLVHLASNSGLLLSYAVRSLQLYSMVKPRQTWSPLHRMLHSNGIRSMRPSFASSNANQMDRLAESIQSSPVCHFYWKFNSVLFD